MTSNFLMVFLSLDKELREQTKQWVLEQGISTSDCYNYRIVADGPNQAAQFQCWERDHNGNRFMRDRYLANRLITVLHTTRQAPWTPPAGLWGGEYPLQDPRP